jgi:hypothetical protein
LESSKEKIRSLANAVKGRGKAQRALPAPAESQDIIETELRDIPVEAVTR